MKADLDGVLKPFSVVGFCTKRYRAVPYRDAAGARDLIKDDTSRRPTAKMALKSLTQQLG